MRTELLASSRQSRGLRLDPRTKLILLVTIAVFILGGAYEGAMQWVMVVLAMVPLLLLTAMGRWRGVLLYSLLFGGSLWLELVALTRLEGMANFLAVTLIGIFLRFTPSVTMGYLTMTTTTVSEFMAAMARWHLPQQVTIPLAVMFRFFPTVAEEWRAIGDAMRLRGIRLTGHKWTAMLEYLLVPMFIGSVKIGEELSQAALSRGLGAPVRRTNICVIGFSSWDVLFIGLCLGAWLIQGWVWLH